MKESREKRRFSLEADRGLRGDSVCMAVVAAEAAIALTGWPHRHRALLLANHILTALEKFRTERCDSNAPGGEEAKRTVFQRREGGRPLLNSNFLCVYCVGCHGAGRFNARFAGESRPAGLGLVCCVSTGPLSGARVGE